MCAQSCVPILRTSAAKTQQPDTQFVGKTLCKRNNQRNHHRFTKQHVTGRKKPHPISTNFVAREVTWLHFYAEYTFNWICCMPVPTVTTEAGNQWVAHFRPRHVERSCSQRRATGVAPVWLGGAGRLVLRAFVIEHGLLTTSCSFTNNWISTLKQWWNDEL